MTLDTAVIPCGGLGRRLRPITNWVPKEMLPVGLKPLLYWALDEAAGAGLLRVVMVVNPHKPIVEAAARQYQGPLDLEFVPQPAFRGLGDALRAAREQLAGAPFVLLQPDQLFDGPNVTAALLAGHRASRLPTVLLGEVRQQDAVHVGAFGRAEVEAAPDGTTRVTRLEARGSSQARFDTGGAATALAPVGRVVYPGDVFELLDEEAAVLPRGAELDDRGALQRLAAAHRLAAVITAARCYDIGVPEGYQDAVSRWPARVS
ncbi:MAG: sugar phosphate nucleotidyltransferase [Gemmatimonadales bacterium]|jgi:UTP-glucose-1-phosphate uridylyltransferase|nr:sugar phosphate nucleotidyltransferase [Gemmatimonadales bacterium]